jgi:hypothetical protein
MSVVKSLLDCHVLVSDPTFCLYILDVWNVAAAM